MERYFCDIECTCLILGDVFKWLFSALLCGSYRMAVYGLCGVAFLHDL